MAKVIGFERDGERKKRPPLQQDGGVDDKAQASLPLSGFEFLVSQLALHLDDGVAGMAIVRTPEGFVMYSHGVDVRERRALLASAYVAAGGEMV